MDNKNDILKFFAFAGFLGSTYWALAKLRKYQSQYENLRDLPVRQISDLASMKKNESTFIKFLVKYAPQKEYEQPVYSNQKEFCQPSDRKVLQKYKTDIINSKQQWIITDSKKDHAISKPVKGYGQIYGDVFQYARNFQQQPLSVFETIWQYIAYGFEFFNDLVSNQRKKSLDPKRRPIIMGPLIGYLYYQVCMLSDTYLIMKCYIDDQGKLVSTIISPSKDFILKEFKDGINSYFILSALSLAGLVISGKLIYQYFRVKMTQWRIRKQARSGVYLNPPTDELADDKLCIICYDSCRNAIFMDCRHCVLCVQCSKSYKQEICPICKNQIDCVKLIYNV